MTVFTVYILNAIFPMMAKLHFQHHYASLQCHMQRWTKYTSLLEWKFKFYCSNLTLLQVKVQSTHF